MIVLIAAMSRGRVIGKNGGLPWGRSMKTDQERYKAMVRGKVVAIGSGTYDPSDEYLHHAKHVYLFTNQPFEATDLITPVKSVEDVLKETYQDDVLVLGGASVFEQFMPHADKLELTYIDADYEGDRFFPEFGDSEWRTVSDESHKADNDNRHDYRFVTLIRK